jgi:putative solute:sodium symporter small subunit
MLGDLDGRSDFRSIVMDSKIERYKSLRLKVMIVMLAVWGLVSLVFGILAVVPLNELRLGGFPLGFWFATEGSVFFFVVLVFVYCFIMSRLDRKFDVHE